MPIFIIIINNFYGIHIKKEGGEGYDVRDTQGVFMQQTRYNMKEKQFHTPQGTLVYWTNSRKASQPNLVFLPGLTADHTLFQDQIAAFKDQWNIFVWDGPGHGKSRPFDLNLDLETIAGYLHDILVREGFTAPILLGQSLGGYISQAYMALYPGQVLGFVALDTGPLQKDSIPMAARLLLLNMRPIFQAYSWLGLKKAVQDNVSSTERGKKHMEAMMEDYGRRAYIDLSVQGFRWIGTSMAKYFRSPADCPTILIVGKKDKAGSVRLLNLFWNRRSRHPLIWISGAGHNANIDQPQAVNRVLASFVRSVTTSGKDKWSGKAFLKHIA